MKNNFFVGFSFDLRRISIGLLMVSVPFFFIGIGRLDHYKYYADQQPKYQNL